MRSFIAIRARDFFCYAVGFALAGAVAVPSVSATAIVYDLSGITQAPIEGNGRHPELNTGFTWMLDWTGAVLTHELGKNTTSFKDDKITITGTIRGCVGSSGSNCLDAGAFHRNDGNKNALYVGAGDFRFDDVSFALDPVLTKDSDDIYAQMDRHIGELDLVSQKLGVGEVQLALKANPELGYAFRLFDSDPLGDGRFQIFSWFMASSKLFVGQARAETRPGESVFNGELFACRRGGSCGGSSSEVPEPASMLLLGSALCGARVFSRRRSGA